MNEKLEKELEKLISEIILEAAASLNTMEITSLAVNRLLYTTIFSNPAYGALSNRYRGKIESFTVQGVFKQSVKDTISKMVDKGILKRNYSTYTDNVYGQPRTQALYSIATLKERIQHKRENEERLS